MEIQKPNIDYGGYNLDFGKGFYLTTLQEQADKWAPRRSKRANAKPIVSIYEFNTDCLNILSIDCYSDEWLDFVLKNREGNAESNPYGGMADDDVAGTVNYYIYLLSKGRIEPEAKNFFLRQLRFQKPNNQYCIATDKGIDMLNFIESYEV
jgi:hypothetical protein